MNVELIKLLLIIFAGFMLLYLSYPIVPVRVFNLIMYISVVVRLFTGRLNKEFAPVFYNKYVKFYSLIYHANDCKEFLDKDFKKNINRIDKLVNKLLGCDNKPQK